MPEYDVCLYIEKGYSKRVTAETPEAAYRAAAGFTEKDWGEPETTLTNEILVRDVKTGDVLAGDDV